MTNPGGINNKFIWKTFASITMQIIGPSIMSVKTKAIVLSKIPKSFEKVLTNLPVGVVSK